MRHTWSYLNSGTTLRLDALDIVSAFPDDDTDGVIGQFHDVLVLSLSAEAGCHWRIGSSTPTMRSEEENKSMDLERV